MDHKASMSKVTPRLQSFPNRHYTASPLGPKRPISSLKASNRAAVQENGDLAVADNIFHASSISSHPTRVTFTPAPRVRSNVFAPGASPAPHKRTLRPSGATATTTPSAPRSKPPAIGPEFFEQEIPDPPSYLTGETLTQRIPTHLEQRGSVYADQYLADLCPPGFDDENRRQFFCILDLRRLKYAANEIFASKDWKINIMNFSREYEKSRSIIMLRYGLYEFKTVKPSEEVLRKWRAAHGLPDPDSAPTISTVTPSSWRGGATKRKADDDGRAADESKNATKRRAAGHAEATPVVPRAQPQAGPGKSKRKASISNEQANPQPTKMQKNTPSATKTLFESIANNIPTTTPSKSATSRSGVKATFDEFVPSPPTVAKSSLSSSTTKFTNGSLARSVFDNLNPGGALQPVPSSGNIFAYLSDASSAKNSGVDADAESGSLTDPETEVEAQNVERSHAPGLVATGTPNPPLTTTGPFLTRKPVSVSSGFGNEPSSTIPDPRERESTPNRSLFNRNSQDNSRQPIDGALAASAESEDAAKVISVLPIAQAPSSDQTWNTSTPIKFAPSVTVPSLGGSSIITASAASSLIVTPATAPTMKAGETQPATADSTTSTPTSESDKENRREDSSLPKQWFGNTKDAHSSQFKQTPINESDKENSSEARLQPKAQPMSGPASTSPSFQFKGESATQSTAGLQPFLPMPTLKSSGDTTTDVSTLPPDRSSASVAAVKPVTAPLSLKDAPHPSVLFGLPAKGSAIRNLSTLSSVRTTAPKPGLFMGPYTGPKPALISTLAPALTRTSTPTHATAHSSAASLENKITTFASGAPLLSGNEAKIMAVAPPSAQSIFKFAGIPSTPPSNAKQPSLLFGAPKTPAASMTTFEGSPMKVDTPTPAQPIFGDTKSSSSSQFQSTAYNFNSSKTGNITASQSVSNKPASIFGQTSTSNTSASAPDPGSSFTFTAGGVGGIANPFAVKGGTVLATGQAAIAPGAGNFDFSFAPTQTLSRSALKSSVAGPTSIFPATSGTGPVTAKGPMFPFGAKIGCSQATAFPSMTTPFNFSANTKTEIAGQLAAPMTTAFGAPSTEIKSVFNLGNVFGSGSTPKTTSDQASSMAATGSRSMFAHLQVPIAGGQSTNGTNSPLLFGGSSLATTPANGTPEPADSNTGSGGEVNEDDVPLQEQVDLTHGGAGEEDEVVLYEVRAKALKHNPPNQIAIPSDTNDKSGVRKARGKVKSPWSTEGVGPFKLLQHKITGAVRMLLRGEPRGNVAFNRTVLPNTQYKNREKYVELVTAGQDGQGLETWMIQVKSQEIAKALADALEAHKGANAPKTDGKTDS